jgi:hypothetical protein
MTSRPPTHANYTKYPKIFSTAYWGAFEGSAAQDINDNRNDFVKEFDIKGHYIKMPKYIFAKAHDPYCKYKRDHVETYKTKDNRCIIVNSPYSVTEEEEAKILADGYIKYKPLYNNMATTYIYIIGSK